VRTAATPPTDILSSDKSVKICPFRQGDTFAYPWTEGTVTVTHPEGINLRILITGKEYIIEHNNT
jgi:hypothetical protein